MHESSYNLMTYFVKKYLPQGSLVLGFGGATENNYKNIIINNISTYKTLDWNEGEDYVVKGYDWSNVPINHFDCVISGQAFEHDSFFWKTLNNIKNVLKSNGLVMIIVPSKGDFHPSPLDCYRFYPDSAIVFGDILNAEILEVIWNNDICKNKQIFQQDTYWGDLGMVFKLK